MKRLSVLVLLVSSSLASAVEIRPQKELRQLAEEVQAQPQVNWSRYRFLSFGTSEAVDLVSDRKTTKMVVATLTLSDKGLNELVYEMKPMLYALDLQALGWTPEMWEDMSRDWVYYKGLEVPDSVVKATGSRFPIMRADVFVSESWKSKWYTQFLKLPPTREKFYADRGINYTQPIYAGTVSETLTVTNHPGKVAYYKDKDGRSVYVRMNYENVRGRNDSKRFPANFDCQYNTIIFQLPNGLDGFASYDGDTATLSRFSDTRVEKDLKGHSIELGHSCFECHVGTKKLANLDDVRDLQLNPGWIHVFNKEKLQKQVAEDQDRWAITLRSMVKMSPAQWQANIERMQTSFRGKLNTARMARELGVERSVLENAMLGTDSEEIVACAQNQETWTREKFEEHYEEIAAALYR